MESVSWQSTTNFGRNRSGTTVYNFKYRSLRSNDTFFITYNGYWTRKFLSIRLDNKRVISLQKWGWTTVSLQKLLGASERTREKEYEEKTRGKHRRDSRQTFSSSGVLLETESGTQKPNTISHFNGPWVLRNTKRDFPGLRMVIVV